MPERNAAIGASGENGQHLIVQTAFLGDVLLGIPLFKALRAESPNHKLVLLCRKGVGLFFIETGLVDEIIEIDKKDKSTWKQAYKKVENQKFDLVICPHESFRSARFVSKVSANEKIGFKRFFNFFIFTRRIERPMEAPEALRQLALLATVSPKWRDVIENFVSKQAARGGQALDGGLVPVPDEATMQVPSLIAIRKAKAEGKEDLPNLSPLLETVANTREPIVVLAPGSVWRTKQWTKEGFIQAGQEYSLKYGALIVIMGAKDERALCEEIAAAIPNSLSLAGRTSLLESGQLLALADLLICNDSGAMHLGAAADAPLVSVFGPTVLEFGYRPWSNRARVVQIPLPCRPCGKHGSRECPIGTHACMRDIGADRVIAAAAFTPASVDPR
jgi:heptosyltransferase II